MLLENQLSKEAKPLITEATSHFFSGMGGQPGDVSTFDQDGFRYAGITAPIVRRLAPALIANAITPVQPLHGPTGKIFYYKIKYNSAMTDYTKTPSVGYAAGAEVFADAVDRTYSGSHVTSAGEMLSHDGYSSIKELNHEIFGATVTATTRKLKSTFSNEIEQDFFHENHLSLREEVIFNLAASIQQEIDQELLYTLRSVATSAESMNYENLDGRWEAEKNINIYNRLQREAANVASTCKFGPANWAVVNTRIASALRSCAAFTPYKVDGELAIDNVPQTTFLGVLDGYFRIYHDWYTNVDEMLIGIKQGSMIGPVIFCPYIMAQLYEARSDQHFEPSLGILSRYGIHQHQHGPQNFVRKVRINNMPV